MKTRIHWNIAILLTLLATGCGPQRVEQLSQRVNSYWEGMQWRAVGNLGNMVEPEDRDKHLNKLAKQLDQMRLVDFSVVNLAVDKQKNQATAVIAYSYYLLNQNDLLNNQVVQLWRYNKKVGWLLKP